MRNQIVIILALLFSGIGEICAEGKRDFIHHLIMDGNEKEVRWKITKFPSLLKLHYTEDSKVLPLHHAAQLGSPELVKFMIDSGAELDATCYNNFTALHLCKSPESAKHLIAAGAKTTIVDSWGKTALQFAALNSRQDVAKAMLEAGATLDIVTATALGMNKEATELARNNPELVKSSDPNQHVLHRNEGPLGVAASLGNLELVKLYIELGADVNAFNHYPLGVGGFSPLINAVVGGHEDVVEFLLAHGADPNVKVGKFGADLLDGVREHGSKRMIAMIEKARGPRAEQIGADKPASLTEQKSEVGDKLQSEEKERTR